MRKYSIKEIDEMRGLIQVFYSSEWGGLNGDIVEERLRTFMMNGTKPKELRKRIKEKIKAIEERNGSETLIQNMKSDLLWLDEDAF